MTRSTRIAELVSAATRLPLLAVPLFLLIGAASAGALGILWALVCLFLTSGLSLLYLAYLVRSGKVVDPGRISQGERTGPLWVVAGLHAGAFALVSLLGAPAPLRAVLLSYVLSTLAFALLTPFEKISLHAAGVAGTLVCLLFVFGPLGALFVPALPAVWWARTKLKRHTGLQLALGAAVGSVGTWLSFQLIG